MEFEKFIIKLNTKAKKADKKAKNPFLENDFAYNPFMSAIEQTYVWIEREKSR